jgi:hypothetical protein
VAGFSSSLSTGLAAIYVIWQQVETSTLNHSKLAPSAVTAICSSFMFVWQVLMLAYQLDSDILRRGSSDVMWEQLQELLGIPSPPHQQQQEERSQATASLLESPTCLTISEGVRVLDLSIDWVRVRRMWHCVPASQVGLGGWKLEDGDGERGRWSASDSFGNNLGRE